MRLLECADVVEIDGLNLAGLSISTAVRAIFLCLPKEKTQKKGHPDRLVFDCPHSELLIAVVLYETSCLESTFAHIPVRSTPINSSPLGKLNGAVGVIWQFGV